MQFCITHDALLHMLENGLVLMQVAISSTDFDPQQAETATIVAAAGNRLTLSTALQYIHFAPSVPTGYNNISMPMVCPVHLFPRGPAADTAASGRARSRLVNLAASCRW